MAALQDMLANDPVESWGEMLDDVIDAPGTVLTVAATAATVFATVMGEEASKKIILKKNLGTR